MITVKINGNDKSSLIHQDSYELEDNAGRPTFFKFALEHHKGQTFQPSLDDDIEVTEGGNKIFVGKIVDRSIKGKNFQHSTIEIVCKDNTVDFDKQLVVNRFSNKDAHQIAIDVINNNTTGFTTNNVKTTSPTIDAITFNYEYPSTALKKLGDIIGWEFYIDEDKDVHFFPRGEEAAPFNLTENAGDEENFIANTLKLKEDLNQLRNVIFVRGGTNENTLSASDAEIETMDEDQTTIQVSRKFLDADNITVERSTDGGSSWSSLTVGSFGTDGFSTNDVLYNPNELFLVFDSAGDTSANDLIRAYGTYELPVLIKRSDNASISKYGTREFRIVDKTITTNDEAKERAQADLRRYAEEIEDLRFETRRDGLEAGQLLSVDLPSHGISGSFIIKSVRTTIKVDKSSGSEKLHKVKAIGKEKIDSIDVLIKLLFGDVNRNIDIKSNEVLTETEAFSETIEYLASFTAQKRPQANPDFTETLTISDDNIRVNPFGADTAPIWVVGPYTPTSDSDRKRMPTMQDEFLQR